MSMAVSDFNSYEIYRAYQCTVVVKLGKTLGVVDTSMLSTGTKVRGQCVMAAAIVVAQLMKHHVKETISMFTVKELLQTTHKRILGLWTRI